jgi:tetratricopeptide (TPR) repeat protein
LSLALEAGDRKGRDENIQMLSGLLIMGPTPVPEAMEIIADYHRRTEGDRIMDAAISVNAEGQLLAMSKRINEARAVHRRARETFRELGLSLWLGASGTVGPTTAEMIGGDLHNAEAIAREGIEILERISPEGVWLREDLRLLIQVLAELGLADDAAAALDRLMAMGDADDPWNQYWPGEVLRAQGRFDEAADVLQATLEAAHEGWLLYRTSIAFSLAKALRGAGRERDAIDAARMTLEMVERKGDLATTAKVRAFLDA